MARKPPKGKSLAEDNPVLAKQWHSTKNGDLTPFDFTNKSGVKVWWKCDKGDDHEWFTRIAKRSNGGQCPICSGRQLALSNCLATVNPKVAKEWHPTKNGDLTPYEVTSASGKRVWWKCDKGDDHEWEARVLTRKNHRGCPVCSGKLVVKSNCLLNTHNDIAKQWHPTKNGNITANDVTAGSNKKFWWKCDKGDDHEWKTTVLSRKEGRGCPVCSGNKLVKSNSLAVMKPEIMKLWHPTKNIGITGYDFTVGTSKKVWWKCDKGDDHEWKGSIAHVACPVCRGLKVVKSNCLATLNPELAEQWHLTKNGNLTPKDVTISSGKKVWWKCDKGDDHEWIANIGKRQNGNRCPMCLGLKAVKSNCLATLNPELAKEWHPTKNGELTPDDVTESSGKRVWWKCDKGDDHEWQQSTSIRSKGVSCAICSGQKVVNSNCLATLNPELAEQWHLTKNGNLTPKDVTVSSGKKVWWKCDKGDDHEWEAKILNRSMNGSSCSICAGYKVVNSNCMATTHPDLANQWHLTKNGNLTPMDVTAGTHRKAWWKCDKGDDHEWLASIKSRKMNGCPSCSEHGFDSTADAIFYIRKIVLKNKVALKYGITNKMDGSRLKQQKRHVDGIIQTIFKVKNDGLTILRIENKCKKFYRKSRYLSEKEFPDGFSETIKYSEESINKIKTIVDEVLNEKAEKKN
jgi:cytochrome c-type biogenesis protein CcmH/NrfF